MFIDLPANNHIWLTSGGMFTYNPPEKTSTFDSQQYLGQVISPTTILLYIMLPVILKNAGDVK